MSKKKAEPEEPFSVLQKAMKGAKKEEQPKKD